jgi:hypothetical protein
MTWNKKVNYWTWSSIAICARHKIKVFVLTTINWLIDHVYLHATKACVCNMDVSRVYSTKAYVIKVFVMKACATRFYATRFVSPRLMPLGFVSLRFMPLGLVSRRLVPWGPISPMFMSLKLKSNNSWNPIWINHVSWTTNNEFCH